MVDDLFPSSPIECVCIDEPFYLPEIFYQQYICCTNDILSQSVSHGFLHSDIYKNCLDGQLIWIVFLLYYLQSLFHMP